MHILVSGGAGYCGSVAVAELLAAGHSVVFVNGNHDPQIGFPAVRERLRKRLEPDPQNPRIIKTVYGAGYMLSAAVEWS